MANHTSDEMDFWGFQGWSWRTISVNQEGELGPGTVKSCEQMRQYKGSSVGIKERYRYLVKRTTNFSFFIWRWEESEWIPVTERDVCEKITEDGKVFDQFQRIGTDEDGKEYLIMVWRKQTRP